MIYRYGYKLRPPGPGCQPKGFTYCTELSDVDYWGFGDDKYWGVVEYEGKLTEEQIRKYDLELIE